MPKTARWQIFSKSADNWEIIISKNNSKIQTDYSTHFLKCEPGDSYNKHSW